MSDNFAIVGAFVVSLAANGISASDIKRVVSKGLAAQVAEAITAIIEADRARDQEQRSRLMRIKNSGVEKLQELSGVQYVSLDFPYEEMMEALRVHRISVINQLGMLGEDELYGFGLHPEQVFYIMQAFEEVKRQHLE